MTTKKKTTPPPPAKTASHEQLAGFREVLAVLRAATAAPAELSDDECLVVMMKGAELGMKEIRSLEQLYLAADRDGTKRVVMRSGAMRAIIQERGVGYIEPVTDECTSEKALVEACRQDRHGVRKRLFLYSLEDAKRNGLMLRQSWASGSNRKELLIGVATSAAASAMFADVLAGVVYTAEQVETMGGKSEPKPVVPETIVPPADTVTAPPAPVAPPVPPPVESQPASGEEPGAAESVTESQRGPADTAAPPPPPPAAPSMNGRVLDQMAGWSSHTPPRPIYSAGASLPTLQRILKYSRAQGGSPRWQEGAGIVEDYLRGLRLDPGVRGAILYLTEAEAVELFARMERRLLDEPAEPASAAPAPEGPAPAEEPGNGKKLQLLSDFYRLLAQNGLMAKKEAIEELLASSAKAENIRALSTADLAAVIEEFRPLILNPQVMLRALDRYREGVTS